MKLYINGKPLPGKIVRVSYLVRKPSDIVESMPETSEEEIVTDVSVSSVVPIKGFDFSNFFVKKPFGASEETLARRVGYGGKKGRKAMKRLRARGYVGIMHVDSLVMPLPPVTYRSPNGTIVEVR